MWAPQIMGNGRALAHSAMASVSLAAIPLLLVWCVAKTALTLLTIRSGASGGVLTPAIALGASMGASLGIVWVTLFPTSGVSVWQCAMVGAVAVLASSQQAPLMALMMLVEITHLPVGSLVPLGLAAAISAGVSSTVLKRWAPRKEASCTDISDQGRN
jgi:H+/Cl- antiporter ClcA